MDLKEYATKEKAIGNFARLEDVWIKISHDLGVSIPLVKLWAHKQRRVSADHVINLEKATGGEVLRHHTRPDIYPPQDYQ